MRVAKAYHEDLGELDDDGSYEYAYRYWVYEFDFDHHRYVARRYTDVMEEASFPDPPRKAEIYDDVDFAAAVRHLVEHEGVTRITAVISSRTGGYVELDLARLLQPGRGTGRNDGDAPA